MNAKDDEVYDSDNDHWIQFTDLSKYCFYYIGYFVFVYFYVIKLPEMITNNSWKTKDKKETFSHRHKNNKQSDISDLYLY